MTIEYTYSQGQWTETNSMAEWTAEMDYADWLQASGFSRHASFIIGPERLDDTGARMCFYRSESGGRTFVEICLDESTPDYVITPDLPSLLLFIKEFGPIVRQDETSVAIRDLATVGKKIFHSHHGHYSDEVCLDCDPVEHQSQQLHLREWQRKRNERQAREGDK